MRWLGSIATLLALGGLCAPALAQQTLRAGRVAGRAPRIDGMLRDWQGAPSTALERPTAVLQGAAAWRGPADASARVLLLWDDAALYVGARVRDERFVRTARPGSREDALVLTVAVPAGAGRWRGTDVWLYAGEAGRSRAVLAAGPTGGRASPVARASIVEAPGDGGYTIEAAIPWSLVGVTDLNRAEVRAAVRLLDADSEARPLVETTLGSAPVDPRNLEALPVLGTGADGGATLDGFLASRGLTGTRPAHDLRGNVSGDARPERVVLVDRFLLVLGPGFRDGRTYYFEELPVITAAGVRSAELRDLDGDGHEDLLLVLRQQNALGSRDLYRVVSMANESPALLFEAEIRKELAQGGFIENRVEVRGGRATEIVVSLARSSGVDAGSWRESPSTEAEPVLLPWGPVRERRYRLSGARFARFAETPNRPSPGARGRPPGPSRGEPPPPPPPAPSTSAVVAAFRRSAGLAAGVRARLRAEGNVAGDRRAEQVLVLDRTLLVVGPGFRGGTGWLNLQLPVTSGDDVLELRLVDLTGDGQAEIVVRVRRATRYGSTSESVEVTRELLLVQQVNDTASARLLAVEVARTDGTNAIRHDVRFVRDGGASRLEIVARPAQGWTRETWRFTEDASSGVEPLLLPWEGRAVSYRWDRRAVRLIAERR